MRAHTAQREQSKKGERSNSHSDPKKCTIWAEPDCNWVIGFPQVAAVTYRIIRYNQFRNAENNAESASASASASGDMIASGQCTRHHPVI
jgi:hypothetical protein